MYLMTTTLDKLLSYAERLQPAKLRDPAITWPH